MGRLLEVKQEMVKLELSEYHYFDDILIDLKLMPNDVEMPIPKYFFYDNLRTLKDREHFLDQLIASTVEDESSVEAPMTLEDAIRLIQRHERARQGRLRARFMREIREQEEMEKANDENKKVIDPDKAAMFVQKAWKGVMTRREVRRIRQEELIWLGMMPRNPHHVVQKSNMVKLAQRVEAFRRVTQNIHEQEYQEALVKIKEKIRDSEGQDMRETMQDQIRQWFIECRDATGKFPDYPEDDVGGSAAIFKEKTPEELQQELLEKEEGNKKEKGKKDDKKKKTDGKKDGKKDDKKKKKDEEPEGWKAAASAFVPSLQEGCNAYDTIWAQRDESENFIQRHDEEIIKEEKRTEVETEVRLQVDELLRQELRNLKIAIDKEKVKRVAKKKGKKGKKGKKKKGKDLTPDRTLISLYEELVLAGVIKKVNKMHMCDYRGEYAYLGTTLRQANIEPQPSISDVRRLVTEYAILPLGSDVVHQKAPWIKSILLTGPRGTGKRTLVNIICNETGANLFDISAENIVGKYPGKEGLRMLIHLVFKVAKLLQPSVIFVNDCEKMMKKKIPKTDTTDPKRLKKELPKAMKLLTPEDRVLLIGCSSAPFDAELKPFCSLYQKIILIPRPDYASRHLIWRALIVRFGGQITSVLDISSLTKISDGYTGGQMAKACQTVLTDRRLAQLNRKRLVASEFVAPLAQFDPVYAEEEEAYKTWYRKTPLGKQRQLAKELEEEAAANPDGGGGGKGGKKSAKGGKGKK